MKAGYSVFTMDQDLKNEFVRKCIHFLIAFVPLLAEFNRNFAMALLAAGVILYTFLEKLRSSNVEIPFFSAIIRRASRQRDKNRFIMGPVTLGLGALLSLLVLPEIPATIAIYALAFGDGLASLVGRMLGRIRPGFLRGKSLEGSCACFFIVLAVSWFVCRDIGASFAAATTATVCEALPIEDYDNIFIPLATGFAANFCLTL
jgi:dolichol kinase